MKRFPVPDFMMLAGVGALCGYRQYDCGNADLPAAKPFLSANAITLTDAPEKDTVAAGRDYVDRKIDVAGRRKKANKDDDRVVIFLIDVAISSPVRCSMDHLEMNGSFNKGDQLSLKGN
jgi:hypothetical protein